MQSSDLMFFLAVAEATSIGRAAKTLNTVQSGVTSRIRKLEDNLGVALFQRHARGVSLTAAGERLLPFARQIMQLLEEARLAVTDDDVPRGRLLLGAMETTAALRLGTMMAQFSTDYPQVELSLRTGTTAEMIALVLRQELEGVFVCGPLAHPQLITRPIFREKLVVVGAPGATSLASLTGSGQVRILVLRRGCSYRQRLEDILARRGVAVVQVMEYGTVDAILACISAGMGISLLPEALLERCVPKYNVSSLKLRTQEAQADTVFVRRSQSYVSGAMTAFLEGFDTAEDRIVPISAGVQTSTKLR